MLVLNRILSYCSIALFACLIFAALANASDTIRIGLQNLQTRTIVYCHSNYYYTAEECAQHYETIGYTRFKDIPSKPANFDSLKVDTYPTRRWRNGELTPRW